MRKEPRVLLVDDEPFIVRAVARLLRAEGFDVTVCQLWTGVASAVRTHDPDLVLLDYHMPMVKGDSICEILKRNGVREGMKIVLYSSEPAEELDRIAAECGADGCIAKNAPSTELVASVRAFLAAT